MMACAIIAAVAALFMCAGTNRNSDVVFYIGAGLMLLAMLGVMLDFASPACNSGLLTAAEKVRAC